MAPVTRNSTRSQLEKEALENAHRSRSTRENTTPERSTAPGTNGSGSQSTPLRESTHALQRPLTIAKMKPALEAELFGGITDVAPANDQIYPSLSHERIPTFITNCSLYDRTSRRWKDLAAAEQQKGEKYLYTPLKKIIESILSGFRAPTREDCWVADTHRVRMKHIEGRQVCNEDLPDGGKKEVTLKSSPDLSILGTGLHFRCGNTRPPSPDYDHCLSPVEIKQASTYNAQTVLIQAGVYARQCFIHQPHRRYVPAVVIAGSDLYLHIYDRSGVLRLDRINVHQDPETFVRIILGVSAVGNDPRTSPLDLRVRHEVANTFPVISVKNNDMNHDALYTVTETKFSRKTIRGRGTYCTVAKVTIGGKVIPVIIKEAWRTLDRSPEYALLADIKGVKGVGQILYYEDDASTITDFRRYIFPAFCQTNPYSLDRKFCRLILQAYGRSVCHFSTKLELIEAFHDAIAGHKYLWEKGILHRDVSVDNILLGEPGAQEGYRGVLIDFDMAIRVDHVSDPDKTRTGTRAFQSYAVLKSGTWGKLAPPQDHLDDLESYLYCLGWICIKYDGTGAPMSPELLNNWEQGPAEACADRKFGFLVNPTLNLNAYFKTPVLRRLISDFAVFCRDHALSKSTIVDIAPPESNSTPFPSLSKVWQAKSKGQDQTKVLEFFKNALEAERAAPKEVPRPRADSIITQYPISQDEYSTHTRGSLPSNSEMDRPTTKRPNPSLNDQDERVSSSKRPRTRSTGKQPSDSQPKASGSKPKTHRGSGNKRVGK